MEDSNQIHIPLIDLCKSDDELRADQEARGLIYSYSFSHRAAEERIVQIAQFDISSLVKLRLLSRKRSNKTNVNVDGPSLLRYYKRMFEVEFEKTEKCFADRFASFNKDKATLIKGSAIDDHIAKSAIIGRKSAIAQIQKGLNLARSYTDTADYNSKVILNKIFELADEDFFEEYVPSSDANVDYDLLMSNYEEAYAKYIIESISSIDDDRRRVVRYDPTAGIDDSARRDIKAIVELREELIKIVSDDIGSAMMNAIHIDILICNNTLNLLQGAMSALKKTRETIHQDARILLDYTCKQLEDAKIRSSILTGRMAFIYGKINQCTEDTHLIMSLQSSSMTPYSVAMRIDISKEYASPPYSGDDDEKNLIISLITGRLAVDLRSGSAELLNSSLTPRQIAFTRTNNSSQIEEDLKLIRTLSSIPPPRGVISFDVSIAVLDIIGNGCCCTNASKEEKKSSSLSNIMARFKSDIVDKSHRNLMTIGGLAHVMARFDILHHCIPSISLLVTSDMLLSATSILAEIHDSIAFASNHSQFSTWQTISVRNSKENPMSSRSLLLLVSSLQSLATGASKIFSPAEKEGISNQSSSSFIEYSALLRRVINPEKLDLEAMLFVCEQALRVFNTGVRFISNIWKSMVSYVGIGAGKLATRRLIHDMPSKETLVISPATLHTALSSLIFPLILCTEVLKCHFGGGESILDGKPFDTRPSSEVGRRLASLDKEILS